MLDPASLDRASLDPASPCPVWPAWCGRQTRRRHVDRRPSRALTVLLRPLLASALLLTLGCDRSEPAVATSTAADAAPTAPTRRAEPGDVAQIETMRDSVERLLDGDRPLDALAIARPLVELAPDDWTAHELHGRAATGTAIVERRARGRTPVADERHREAAESYDRAAQLAAEQAPHAVAPLLRTAGLMLDAVDDLDGAVARYERAALADPIDPQSPLFAAQAHLRQNDLARAKVLIDRVLALEPEEPWGWATRAEIERLSGESATALASMRTARRLDPANHVLRLREARLLRLLDRAEDGLTLLMALPEADRTAHAFVEEIAMSWRAVGEPARGAEAWERLAAREPHEWRHGLQASRLWLEAGDPVRAGAALEPALLAAPDDDAVLAQREAIGAALAAEE